MFTAKCLLKGEANGIQGYRYADFIKYHKNITVMIYSIQQNLWMCQTKHATPPKFDLLLYWVQKCQTKISTKKKKQQQNYGLEMLKQSSYVFFLDFFAKETTSIRE